MSTSKSHTIYSKDVGLEASRCIFNIYHSVTPILFLGPKISSIETLQNAINLEEFEYLQGNIYDLSYLEGLNKLKKVTIGLNDDYIELINVPKHLEDIIYHQRRT